MVRKFVFACCILFSLSGKCQDSSRFALGTDLIYHPQDLFFHVRGQLEQKNKLTHDIFLGFGIQKTLFQSQFRPHLGYDLAYRFKLNRWFSVSPFLRLSYSFLGTKIPVKRPGIHTTESFAACRISFGEKNRVALSAGIGPALEWKYNHYYGRMNHFFMWNYFAELAYYYAF